MGHPLAKYAFINAKLRARISKILPHEMFLQLAKTASLDALLILLKETPFSELETIYSSTGDLKQAELKLIRYEIELYREIKQHLHPDSLPLVDALLAQFEIDNLKNAIRVYFDRKVRERPIDTSVHYIMYEPIIHDIPIDIILYAESFDEIAGLCQHTPYSPIIRKYAQVVESEGSLFSMEIALDHMYYKNLLSAAQHLDRKDRQIAIRLIGAEIDTQNISWIIRLKKYYDLPLEKLQASIIPGGITLNKSLIDELYRAQNVTSVLQGFVKGSYPEFMTLLTSQASGSTSGLVLIRRILEEIRKQEVQRILIGYPFTIGIILAYFLLKREELRKIRKLLIAKQYGRQPESIESMM